MLREDLIEEFHTLAQTHTTTIWTLLEEFTDNQLLLPIEMDRYECEPLQAEKVMDPKQGKQEASPENTQEKRAT